MRDILSLSLSIKIRLLVKIYDRRLSAWADRTFDQADKWRVTFHPRWPFDETTTIRLIQLCGLAIIAVGLMAAMAYAPR